MPAELFFHDQNKFLALGDVQYTCYVDIKPKLGSRI